MATRIVTLAPAKINLFLDITGTASNGYHELVTVMQAVSLCDLVVVGRTSSPEIRVTCSRPGIPEDESNLAYRAAAAMLALCKRPVEGGVHIHIDKSIPEQAGLGGGSADAAAVLVSLNRMLRLNLPAPALAEVGLGIGADVPFALQGGCALAKGVGEKLTPITGLPSCWLLIAKPKEMGMSTPMAYTYYDAHPSVQHSECTNLLQALELADCEVIGNQLFNVFEQTCPGKDTARIQLMMTARGAFGAVLSGSGSAVAGIFPTYERADECNLVLPDCETFLVRPASQGIRILHES